jgi:hypothetical protein
MLKRNVALAIAGGALALAAIGTAVAAIPGEDGVVQACVAEDERSSRTGLLGPRVTLDREGALRAVDAEEGQTCADDEQPLSFNVKGEQGEPGEPGPAGPPGPGVGGSIALHDDHSPLPTDFNFSSKRLSADGTGVLEVPFPARLQVNGTGEFAASGASHFIQCHLRLHEGAAPEIEPGTPLAGESISGEWTVPTDADLSNIANVSMTGSAEVEPGDYDVSVVCRATASGNPVNARWIHVDLNVLAVPG